jgi:hypothetical protein
MVRHNHQGNGEMMRALAIIFALIWCSTEASANCQRTWGPVMKQRPEITCVSLTDNLLYGLAGSTKAEVVEAMKAQGIPKLDGGRTILHFVSAADRLGGDMNFELTGERVSRIFGKIDGRSNPFVWNQNESDE